MLVALEPPKTWHQTSPRLPVSSLKKAKRGFGPNSGMDAQGIPACRALSDTAETKQTKELCYALCVNYAAFHEENSGTCGVLTIFLSNLGKQNNELLGPEKKRKLHGRSGEPPIPPLNAEIFKKIVMRILSLPQMLPSYNSLYFSSLLASGDTSIDPPLQEIVRAFCDTVIEEQ